ncbi:DUF6932 family protein [Rossellomorea marisflavi]|uniref:DUF6932 family protein n=1 Tax=Rossellomorea marisflavi TaxID=189381 RepID=UPI0009A7097D|nr:hypothetical protein [Rossellomorea marisflavi]
MPEFLPDGNLLPGIHEYNVEDFKKQFVEDFTESSSRERIYKDFCIWIEELNRVLPPAYMWLDGSYVTEKPNPNDMDIIVFYCPKVIQIKGEEVSKQIGYTVNEVSRRLNCDAYLCYTLENFSSQELARLPDQMTIMDKYWMGQFGFDRQRRPKGIVELPKEQLLLLGGERSGISSRENK